MCPLIVHPEAEIFVSSNFFWVKSEMEFPIEIVSYKVETRPRPASSDSRELALNKFPPWGPEFDSVRRIFSDAIK